MNRSASLLHCSVSTLGDAQTLKLKFHLDTKQNKNKKTSRGLISFTRIRLADFSPSSREQRFFSFVVFPAANILLPKKQQKKNPLDDRRTRR